MRTFILASFLFIIAAVLAWPHLTREHKRHGLYNAPCAEVLQHTGANANCVTIFFGTTRQANYSEGRHNGYRLVQGYNNRMDDQLHYGRAEVVLPYLASEDYPEGRARGELKYSKDGPPEDALTTQTTVSITSINSANKDTVISELKDAVSLRSDSVLLFIHGYNVDFDSAVVRSAQLAVDLTFDPSAPPDDTNYAFGQPVLFSWPNGAAFYTYPWDQKKAEASAPFLAEFLSTLTKETDVKTFNIIIHSMGNRVFANAVEAFAEDYVQQGKGDTTFRIIHAAADVDQDIFDDVMDKVEKKNFVPDTTVYASRRDFPLGTSFLINPILNRIDGTRGRLGQITTRDGIYVRNGVTSIDATGFATDLFGHGYFANSDNILSDVACDLKGVPVEDRPLAPERRKYRGDDFPFYKVDKSRNAQGCAIRAPISWVNEPNSFMAAWRAANSENYKRCWDGSEVPQHAECPPRLVEDADITPEPLEAVVYFDWQKAVIGYEGFALLEEIAIRSLESEILSIRIEGHSDTSEDDNIYTGLSRQRAAAVRDVLISFGIPAELIEVSAFGDLRPALATEDNVREPLNRRVEVTIEFE